MALGNFTLDIDRFVARAKGNVDLVVRKVSLDLFKRVIVKSPVDTGRFKSNWQVAVGSIPSGTINTFDKSGGASLSRVAAASPGFVGGTIIYLVNNVHYAIGLEYGRSKQAPAGMVRLSIAEYSAIVNRAAGQVKP